MRRTSLLAAAAAVALSVSGPAANAAPIETICIGNTCVCVYQTGRLCYTPPPSKALCVAVDLDGDGDAEVICVNNRTT